MSEDLDDILAEFEKKPSLNKTLEAMDNSHFMQVANAVNDEYIKRGGAMKPSEMTQAEFEAAKARIK